MRDQDSIAEPSCGFVIRSARADDRAALADLYADMGAYYAALAPDEFTRPDLTSFEPPRDSPDLFHAVAELDGHVIAAIAAVVLPPEDEHGIDPGLAVPRLRIDFLATTTAHRRTGAGTALVEAAEAWGQAQGAQVAEVNTDGRHSRNTVRVALARAAVCTDETIRDTVREEEPAPRKGVGREEERVLAETPWSGLGSSIGQSARKL